MKKLVMLLVLALTFCVACSPTANTPPEPTSTPTLLTEEEKAFIENIETAIDDAMSGMESPGVFGGVSDETGNYVITINYPYRDITNFGECIIKCVRVFDELESDRPIEYTIYLRSTEPMPVMKFTPGDDYYGTLIDFREGALSGKWQTEADVLDAFPAAYEIVSQKENNISDEDMALYTEIMDILNSDFSRSEDDIIEEIAPNYGMTPEEVKEFLFNMLERLY